MGCACRGGTTPSGQKTLGYRVTFRDGTEATYLTVLEAKAEVRRAGGGSIRRLLSEPETSPT